MSRICVISCSARVTFTDVKYYQKAVQWVWGLVTVNWKSMKASRPWYSLAPGSFDT